MLGNKEIMATNLSRYVNASGRTRNQICEDLNIAYSTFTDWMLGKKYPRIDKIELLANYFGISKSDLVEEFVINDNPTEGKRIPVYGRVAAGIPLEAITDISDYEEIPSNWVGEYFALKVNGDSMAPRITDGDVIIARKQSYAETGDVVVAIVNEQDATVKKIIINQQGVTLLPFNPAYDAMFFEDGVKILGRVVESRSKF